jgi:rhodanese-related sulfurtransferase
MQDPAAARARRTSTILARCVALLLASLCIGMVFNHAHPNGVKWRQPGKSDNESKPDPGDPPENDALAVSAITWEEAEPIVEAGEAVLVDSRSRAAYQAGCIPGAVSLPVKKIDDAIADFIQKYGLDTILIVYCADPACGTSKTAAQALIEYGYENVFYMAGGYAEWQIAQASRPSQRPEDEQ